MSDPIEKAFKALESMSGPSGGGKMLVRTDVAKAIILEAVEASNAWRPIETAPKDGTRILCWNGKFIECYRWLAYKGRWEYGDVFNPFQPTHWRPLPDPPREGGET